MEFNIAFARIALIVAVFGLPIAVSVYWDAKRRGERWPVAWALFSGLLVLAGLAVYVLRRDSGDSE